MKSAKKAAPVEEAVKVAEEAKTVAEVAVLEVKEEGEKLVADVEKTEAAAKKSVKKAEAAAKKSVKKAEAAAKKGVKKAEATAKKSVKKAEATVKAGVKKAEASVKKSVKKSVAKKAAVESFVQFAGIEVSVEELSSRAKEAIKAEHKGTAIASLKLYVKPEDRAAYYVVNDNFAGKLDF